LTLILDLPPESGLERAALRRGATAIDRFEREDLAFHQTLREAFLAIARAEPERCVVIDAGPSEREVGEAIWAAARRRFASLLGPRDAVS
jgi:dTMP kinase